MIDDAVRVFLALVLLAAGITKWWRQRAFTRALKAFDMLPASFVGPFAAILTLLECLIGALLAANCCVRVAAVVAAALFALFAIVVSMRRAQGRVDLMCGCFGGDSTLSWGLALRNLGLLALSSSLITPPFASTLAYCGAGAVGFGAFIGKAEQYHVRSKRTGGAQTRLANNVELLRPPF